jgi:hypothetical protein
MSPTPNLPNSLSTVEEFYGEPVSANLLGSQAPLTFPIPGCIGNGNGNGGGKPPH